MHGRRASDLGGLFGRDFYHVGKDAACSLERTVQFRCEDRLDVVLWGLLLFQYSRRLPPPKTETVQTSTAQFLI